MKPVSTSIAYSFGDDGIGNVRFPAITICPSSYSYFSEAHQDLRNCPTKEYGHVHSFWQILECYQPLDSIEVTSTTTESVYGFGGIFTEQPLEEFVFEVKKKSFEYLKSV